MAPVAETPALGHENTTSHRLAATIADGGHRGAFKKRVGLQAGAATEDYVLAPDVSLEQFQDWLRDVKTIVGADNVSVNTSSKPADHDAGNYLDQPSFTDFFPIDDLDRYMASAMIFPASVEDVVAIVKASNQHTVPIHPISQGRNLGYGGSSPRLRGTAILNLKRMDKILEINEESAYCLLEPGVTYFELYERLQELKSNLWIDCPDIGWGSVIGNTCERGAGYTPYGDHLMFSCGYEVVLPTGEIMRTGMGAMPGSHNGGTSSENWQLFQHGVGPSHQAMFTQSNLGIVTKMGVWLLPNPGGYRPFLITVPRKDQLHELMERIRPLRNNMIIQNAATVRHILLDAACIKSKAQWQGSDDDTPLTEERIEAIAKELDLGYWGFYGALYGPPPVQQGIWAAIWGSMSQIEGAKHYFEEDVGPQSILHSRAKTLAGIPNLLELDWISWLPNGAHCFFSPISAVTGKAAVGQCELVERKAREKGFDFFNTLIVGLRELHNICCLVYDCTSKDQRDRMRELIRECIDEAAEHGWGEYRTHHAFMDQIAGTYSWGDNSTALLNNTMKDAIDPVGILSPGKYGVWPKRYRGQGH